MNRAVTWIKSHQFLVLIFCVLVIAFGMSWFSLWIYKASGSYRFDLSRPGYEGVRDEIQGDDNTSDPSPYPTVGPLDAASIQDFQKRFNRITENLDKMSSFDAEVVSDENLGFAGAPEGIDPDLVDPNSVLEDAAQNL